VGGLVEVVVLVAGCVVDTVVDARRDVEAVHPTRTADMTPRDTSRTTERFI
jgi:hypothetical protein